MDHTYIQYYVIAKPATIGYYYFFIYILFKSKFRWEQQQMGTEACDPHHSKMGAPAAAAVLALVADYILAVAVANGRKVIGFDS